MRKSLFAWVALCLAGMCQAAVYTEAGDAGDGGDPQNVAGSAITRIEGMIGGSDTVDAFRFYFSGGPLRILAQVETAIDADAAPSWLGLPIALFREQALAGERCRPGNPCASDGSGELDLSDAQLIAGNYVLETCYPPNPCIASDPPFHIDLIYPTTGQLGTPMPEPPLLPLLALGLVALRVQRSGPGSRVFARWGAQRRT